MAKLADPATTTAIYMPVKTLAALSVRAIAEGLDPQTPALAIARATRPDQQAIAATIAELPARLQEAQLPGPVLIMLVALATLTLLRASIRKPADA